MPKASGWIHRRPQPQKSLPPMLPSRPAPPTLPPNVGTLGPGPSPRLHVPNFKSCIFDIFLTLLTRPALFQEIYTKFMIFVILASSCPQHGCRGAFGFGLTRLKVTGCWAGERFFLGQRWCTTIYTGFVSYLPSLVPLECYMLVPFGPKKRKWGPQQKSIIIRTPLITTTTELPLSV